MHIPISLSNASSLVELLLADNHFSGPMPRFGELSNLRYLFVAGNIIEDDIVLFRRSRIARVYKLSRTTTGVLKNTSAISLEGNKELCGGILELDLPPCTSSKKKNLSTHLKIGIPVVAGVAAILCFVVFIYKRRTPDKNMPYVPSFTGIPFLSLSYADLLKATSGFAETNLAKGSLDKWLYCINSEQEEGEFRNLDLIERLGIAINVAHALEYLHCGIDSIITHGDLKPSNILLDEDMTACVGDFELSKITSSIPESSSTIGIREYGMSNSVSTKGDVYSYRILVLEMFTNRRPTDDSLSENGNLHNFVSTALPNRLMEIVDPLIRMGPHVIDNGKLEDCMCSIMRIGVSCSTELPRERMLMSDVVRELHRIQKELCS
ncbi:PREDICTED: probable LRR receptor-like serine/threonine-protein kinase At3g47570 [Erythranthe guttata]|uniref:probable LRR receptor-like serine/threonine-protein kinase At3g47570 n=1 Tax=Erythranthe guttata TaxID=4155 RepID=UPI00064DAE4B|nr:PREDICTED: probable LRR receptor-like serine/threonine-protein kinase At3g47570 [Erythranthe guttata]|eukprot:XP_012845862.1 PREDICTED: probable LRR receptor-like serine/threonine-protein kinase At3g47570 [Erythranthe guttata]